MLTDSGRFLSYEVLPALADDYESDPGPSGVHPRIHPASWKHPFRLPP